MARSHPRQLIKSKFHKNVLEILKSRLVEAKRCSNLEELTAHVKSVWANFKPAMLPNMPVGMPQHVFMCLLMKWRAH